MKFQKLKQILEYLIVSRVAMDRLYQRLSLTVDSPKAAVLLHNMAQHQINIINKLNHFLDTCSDQLLGTDFSHVYFEDFVARCDCTDVTAGMNERDALSLAQHLESRLLAFVHSALVETACGEVKRLLANLLESERGRQHHFTEHAFAS